MTKAKQPTKTQVLDDLAAKIRAHLKRFETDPVINKPKVYREGAEEYRAFYNTNAYRVGRCVGVVYVSYQGTSKLTLEEAQQYLAWLDAGNIRPHFAMQRKTV